MKRLVIANVMLLFQAGCLIATEPTTSPSQGRAFQVGKVAYLIAYESSPAQSLEVFSEDGAPEMVSQPAESTVLVSRGDGSQFTQTTADEREARSVARAYCQSLSFDFGDPAEVRTQFAARSGDDNAEWRIFQMCAAKI